MNVFFKIYIFQSSFRAKKKEDFEMRVHNQTIQHLVSTKFYVKGDDQAIDRFLVLC